MKCAYVFFQLNGKVSWDLVTYFNKIQYDMHTDVGSYFVFNLKYMCYEIKGLKNPRKQNLKDKGGINGRIKQNTAPSHMFGKRNI